MKHRWVGEGLARLEEPLVGFRISRRKIFQMEKCAAAQYLTNYVFDKYATARITVDDYAN